MTPRVSIVIPCYNKRAYVAAAIESALAQTARCEVIVVDDGSTDGSFDEVRRFERRIILETGPNRGGSAARNRGLTLATGDYVQFLDADDLLPPDKISIQLAALADAPTDAMAFCPWSLFRDDGTILPPGTRRYWRDYPEGLALLIDMWTFGGFFPPHAWLAPRALIDRAGHWDEALTGDDDGEFFGRLLVHAGQIRFCEGTKVLYRDPPEGSVSRDRSRESAGSFWQSFEIVSQIILTKRSDDVARRACLSRARQTAYAWSTVPEVLEEAAAWERQHGLFDLSPSLPHATRYLVGLLGVKHGLALIQVLKGSSAR